MSAASGATLRAVSKHVRRVSLRVVSLAGGGPTEHAIKLEDDPSDPEEHNQTPPQAQPLPAAFSQSRLRGKTLGIFGPDSPIRLAVFHMMIWRWTEPIILLLIFANAIILTIQSGRSVFTHPRPNGYFNEWEDYALFVLFILFTLEILARVIVSGLLVDPELPFSTIRKNLVTLRRHPHLRPDPLSYPSTTSLTQGMESGVLHDKYPPPRTHHALSKPKSASGKRGWSKDFFGVTEAPFQEAVAKQRSLSEQGRPYLRHSWNRVDFIAVVSFWIMFALSITGHESTPSAHIYIFRALSVLRVSRLLAVTSGTATIMRSLKIAGPLLVRVAYFVLFAMILFSIVGVQSFQGSYRRNCVLQADGQDFLNITQTCGGHIDPTTMTKVGFLDINGINADTAKGFICPLGQLCKESSTNPNTNLESFDNILFAALQVVIVASANGWSPVMYNMMDAEYFISCFFFIICLLILNFWLINLFVAVITNTFSAIRAETQTSAFGAGTAGPILDEQDEGWSIIDGKHIRSTSALLKWYEYVSFTWVVLALVSLAFQASRAADSTDDYKKMLDDVEFYLTIAFDVEIVWRIAGHFPDWRSFKSKTHNNLDLVLAIGSSIVQIPAIHRSRVYPWFTIFQLARFYRVILFVPRMRPLLLQVFGNMRGLVNMSLFLLLTNFLGALITVQLFRGDIQSTVNMNFAQVYSGFLAMYQVFSSENWTDVLYGTSQAEVPFKQAPIAILLVSGWFLFANFILLQMFIAVINENFEVAEEQKRAQQVQAYIRQTEPASTGVNWIDRWNPYRFMRANPKAIVVDNLPSNLILPMNKSVVRDQRVVNQSNTTQTASAFAIGGEVSSSMQGFTMMLRRFFATDPETEAVPLTALKGLRRESVAPGDLPEHDETERHLEVLAAVNTEAHIDEDHDATAEQRAQRADFIAAHPTYDKTFWVFSQKHKLRKLCQKLVIPSNGDRIFGTPPSFVLQAFFQLIILLAVVGGIIVAAIATPIYRRQYYMQHGFMRSSWFDIAEVTFGFVLVVEFLVKILADGFIFTPNAYLLSIWNVVDFLILIALLVNVGSTLAVIGGISRLTRSLKAFRALRLITLFGWMRNTFHSVIFAGAARIFDAAVLAILYMIPYAVWGLNIFSGLLLSCNDGNRIGKSDCVNEYINTPLDSSNVNLGFLAPRVWANPTQGTVYSFDTFRASLLILFEIVSLEGWINVMAAATGITGLDSQPVLNSAQVNSIFFLAYNLLGAVVILTLFVSIIIGNFSSRSGMALLTSEQRQWIDLQKLLNRQTPSKRPKVRPTSRYRSWCFDRAVHKHGWWSRLMTIMYCLHIIALTSETFDNFTWLRNVVFLFLTCVYFIDLIIRVYGLGWSFLLNGWNLFDVFVVMGSFATTLPVVFGSDGYVMQQLQKLFLVCIAFKLVQKFNSLNQLFKTAVASLPAIVQLLLLWFALFVFFAIAMVEVFALTRLGSQETHNANYQSFGKALVMLAFMCTGEGWNAYMHNYAVVYPACTPSSAKDPDSDCGSIEWAFFLFIFWNVLSMYIFVNMFTGVVVENFSYVFSLTGPTSVTREEMRAFKKVWAEFDPGRTGYITRSKFVAFFGKLSGNFEVSIYPSEFRVPNIINASQLPEGITPDKHLKSLDSRKLNSVLNKIDPVAIRKRRMLYNRLYHEALISEEDRKGISFNNMLLLLAHYKLIDDDEALRVDELLLRRTTIDYVTDRMNLDRVRSLLRMIYHRRKYLALREEQSREDIPAIVVDDPPSTPPLFASQPIIHTPASLRVETSSNSSQRPSLDQTLASESNPSTPARRHTRRISDISMLSADFTYSPSPRNSISGGDTTQVLTSMSNSIWGEMMLQAAEEEDDDHA
ncbi:hypothetical protein BOTBODRAFT_591897 [Botryobasidium botryosum FD-172 SS1]|uniref:Calcium-channel protein CCH1 n=1 Tax=Botryobasidium botryosum (strain FD-172 SS1) TaxID=930990 RepID=A0A067LZI3_BOTB1|nr:hypothetical protein BOTBODRAFT_591897 [Botryobasidium botryosum FD-172 SS1]